MVHCEKNKFSYRVVNYLELSKEIEDAILM